MRKALPRVRGDDAYTRGGLEPNLKIYEVFDLDLKTIGDAAEQVDADADLPGLDLPNMRLIASDHERELTLRKTLPLPICANRRAKAFFSVAACHALMVCGRLAQMT